MGLGRAWVWANRPGMFHLVAVVIVVILAAAIRFRYVHAPMDYDEAYSYLNYARRPLYQGLADYNSTNNHLLNTLAMHLADFGFGPREWALRLHVLLAGIGVVATSYVLRRSLLGA